MHADPSESSRTKKADEKALVKASLTLVSAAAEACLRRATNKAIPPKQQTIDMPAT